jgi:serine/threonine-protein kinase RIO1
MKNFKGDLTYCFSFAGGYQVSIHKNHASLDNIILQAIDPRTRMVLFKMLNRGVFNDINGCISTGKEVHC